MAKYKAVEAKKKKEEEAHECLILVSISDITNDLLCLFPLSPTTVSGRFLTMKTIHAVCGSGQVSGFIIFGSDLHNTRVIKLNLHNFFDYTCY